MRRILRFGGVCMLALALGACSSLNPFGGEEKKEDTDGKDKRETVMPNAQRLEPNAGVERDWIKLPSAVKGNDWPLPGGNAMNAPAHPMLAARIEKVWDADIGDGSSGRLRLLARPVVFGAQVFAMDASGHVAAFAIKDGARQWRVSTQAEDDEADEAIGGGIAFDQGRIYAATGHGEVVALDARDGKTLWRRKLQNPLRSAPTVDDGRVYVVSIANTTTALAAKDGEVLWTHNGMAQAAALMGAAAPAVSGDTAVVAYSSGEIFALRAQNGRVAWGDVLVTPMAVGALPEMADIRGAPVIEKGGVFAVSHSGRMAALIMRSGERAWELDIGGINAPAVAGNTLYVLTNEQKLIAVRRDNGKIIWSEALPRLEDPDDKESGVINWTGPLLAGGRLFLVNSNRQLAEYGALDGKPIATHALPRGSSIVPVAAQGMLFVVTNNGKLVAFR